MLLRNESGQQPCTNVYQTWECDLLLSLCGFYHWIHSTAGRKYLEKNIVGKKWELATVS